MGVHVEHQPSTIIYVTRIIVVRSVRQFSIRSYRNSNLPSKGTVLLTYIIWVLLFLSRLHPKLGDRGDCFRLFRN
jgi:hypothetical protein